MELFIDERVEGIEPSSSAWKADIMSHYTTPARLVESSKLSSKKISSYLSTIHVLSKIIYFYVPFVNTHARENVFHRINK